MKCCMAATQEILTRAEEREALRIKKRCVSDERRRIRGKRFVSLWVAAELGHLLRFRSSTYSCAYASFVAQPLHLNRVVLATRPCSISLETPT